MNEVQRGVNLERDACPLSHRQSIESDEMSGRKARGQQWARRRRCGQKAVHSYARGGARRVFARPDVPRVLFVNWASGRERHSNARLVFALPHN